jgi:hypothetical protein
MSLLRHPVVITTLEEDFRRIGLIKDDGRDDLMEAAPEMDDVEDDHEIEDDWEEGNSEQWSVEDDEVDEACASKGGKKKKMPPMGEDEDDEDDEAMAEAIAFHESAKEMWEAFGPDTTIELDESEMGELEGMASEVTTLPAGIIDEAIDDDEDEAIEEDEDEEDEGGASSFTAVAEAMSAIESVLSEDAEPPHNLDEAAPAFANLALISEKLYGFFAEAAEADEDQDYAEIAESFKNIGQYSAAIVDTLQTEDPDTINFDALTEVFNDYLGTVLQGLETYAILREASEDPVEDEDEDEGDEFGEDDEGND